MDRVPVNTVLIETQSTRRSAQWRVSPVDMLSLNGSNHQCHLSDRATNAQCFPPDILQAWSLSLPVSSRWLTSIGDSKCVWSINLKRSRNPGWGVHFTFPNHPGQKWRVWGALCTALSIQVKIEGSVTNTSGPGSRPVRPYLQDLIASESLGMW